MKFTYEIILRFANGNPNEQPRGRERIQEFFIRTQPLEFANPLHKGDGLYVRDYYTEVTKINHYAIDEVTREAMGCDGISVADCNQFGYQDAESAREEFEVAKRNLGDIVKKTRP